MPYRLAVKYNTSPVGGRREIHKRPISCRPSWPHIFLFMTRSPSYRRGISSICQFERCSDVDSPPHYASRQPARHASSTEWKNAQLPKRAADGEQHLPSSFAYRKPGERHDTLLTYCLNLHVKIIDGLKIETVRLGYSNLETSQSGQSGNNNASSAPKCLLKSHHRSSAYEHRQNAD